MGGEPNDGGGSGCGSHCLTEDYLQYFNYGGTGGAWNDFPNDVSGVSPYRNPIAYVFEYDHDPAAVPDASSSATLLGLSLRALAGLKRFSARRR